MQSGTESSALFHQIMQNVLLRIVLLSRSSPLPDREVPHNVWLFSLPQREAGEPRAKPLSSGLDISKINQGFRELGMVL